MNLKVLADPERLEILALISREPLGEQELADMTRLSLRTLYEHLAVLREGGALELVLIRGRRGLARYSYRASEQAKGLGQALEQFARKGEVRR